MSNWLTVHDECLEETYLLPIDYNSQRLEWREMESNQVKGACSVVNIPKQTVAISKIEGNFTRCFRNNLAKMADFALLTYSEKEKKVIAHCIEHKACTSKNQGTLTNRQSDANIQTLSMSCFVRYYLDLLRSHGKFEDIETVEINRTILFYSLNAPLRPREVGSKPLPIYPLASPLEEVIDYQELKKNPVLYKLSPL